MSEATKGLPVKYVVHDESGSIWFVMTSAPGFVSTDMKTHTCLEVPTDTVVESHSHYIRNGEVAERAMLTPSVSKISFTADGVDMVTISELPDPCTVSMQGIVQVPPTEVAGGTITITSNKIGQVIVGVSGGISHMNWNTTLNAV